MRFAPFHYLQYGSTVFLSKDRTRVMVSVGKTHHYYVLSGRRPQRVTPQTVACYGPDFEKILVVTKDNVDMGLARFDMTIGEDISNDVLGVLGTGVPGTMYLGQLGDNAPCREPLKAVFIRVLRRKGNRCTLFGILTRAEPSPLGPDQNVVGVLDLLGYSDIIRGTPIDDLVKKLGVNLRLSLWVAEMFSPDTMVRKGMDFVLPEELRAVDYAVISDTVILYLRKVGEPSLRSICRAVAILIDMTLVTGWLLRGAIDTGTFRVVPEQSVYVGTALVDAHDIEQAQEWCGCVLSHRVEEMFSKEVKELMREGLLVRYDVLFKAGSRVSRRKVTAVNWCFYKSGNADDRRPVLKRLLEEANVRGRRKAEETLKFLNNMEKRGLASVSMINIKAFDIEVRKDMHARDEARVIRLKPPLTNAD